MDILCSQRIWGNSHDWWSDQRTCQALWGMGDLNVSKKKHLLQIAYEAAIRSSGSDMDQQVQQIESRIEGSTRPPRRLRDVPRAEPHVPIVSGSHKGAGLVTASAGQPQPDVDGSDREILPVAGRDMSLPATPILAGSSKARRLLKAIKNSLNLGHVATTLYILSLLRGG